MEKREGEGETKPNPKKLKEGNDTNTTNSGTKAEKTPSQEETRAPRTGIGKGLRASGAG